MRTGKNAIHRLCRDPDNAMGGSAGPTRRRDATNGRGLPQQREMGGGFETRVAGAVGHRCCPRRHEGPVDQSGCTSGPAEAPIVRDMDFERLARPTGTGG